MSDTPNLDAAIAASGQKVPFKPVFTLDDVRKDETRAQALIALIKTPKETALEVLDGVEALAAVAVPIAFPAAAPFVGLGLKALDRIEEIIRRGRIEPTEDAKALLDLYAEFNGLRDSLPTKPTEPSDDEPTDPTSDDEPTDPTSEDGTQETTSAARVAASRRGDGAHVPTGHQDTSGGHHGTDGGHHDAHGNPVNADGSPIHSATKKRK